jgi:multimeric flavodoxin WrbA
VAKYFKEILLNLSDFTGSVDLMDAKNFEIKQIFQADGYIFGSPDYFGYVAGYIKAVFDELYMHRTKIEKTPTLGFITHGGGGKAKVSMQNLIKWNNLNLLSSIITIKDDNLTKPLKNQIQTQCIQLIQH